MKNDSNKTVLFLRTDNLARSIMAQAQLIGQTDVKLIGHHVDDVSTLLGNIVKVSEY